MLSHYGSMVLKALFISIIFVMAYILFLVVFQRKFIYIPSSYDKEELQMLPQKVRISYFIGTMQQTAFYIPPKSSKSPKCLWIMLGGNASLALWWGYLIDHYQYNNEEVAFLLVDYPGYGLNDGAPNIIDNFAAPTNAYNALIEQVISVQQTKPILNVLGHSLGSSIAAAFTKSHDVNHLLLLSPFTSMEAMVKQVMPMLGAMVSPFLKDRYDIASDINDILVMQNHPKITIIHGDEDKIVPVAMSREMTSGHHHIQYIEIKGADHNFIFQYTSDIIEVMQSACRVSKIINKDPPR